jgi:VanZ family protein
LIAGLRHRAGWLIVGWLLIAAVFITCLLPAPAIRTVAVLPDKVEHALAYFAVTLWFVGLYPKNSLWRIVLAFFLMGCAIEILQGTVTTTREMDVHDVFANCVGIGAAAAMALLGGAGWAAWIERRWQLLKGRP